MSATKRASDGDGGGLSRDDVDYVLETFPLVKKRDVEVHGEYRTKRLILEAYDAMGEATRGGGRYQTPLDPPPADPRVAHPNTAPESVLRARAARAARPEARPEAPAPEPTPAAKVVQLDLFRAKRGGP